MTDSHSDMDKAATAEPAVPVEVRLKHKKSIISEQTADIIGMTGSLVAGGATAKFYVDTSLYKNMSSLGLFDDMKPARRADFKRIEALRDGGKISANEAYYHVQSLVKKNEAKADVLLGRLGVSGWLDRFGLLRAHQKIEAGVWSMAAGSVALGSVLQLTRGLFTKEQEDNLVVDKGAPESPGK